MLRAAVDRRIADILRFAHDGPAELTDAESDELGDFLTDLLAVAAYVRPTVERAPAAPLPRR